MSNVVNNKHKYNNQSNNSIARVGQQQSINQRVSTPENHTTHRPDHRLTYSNVARQGIPQPHESVIQNKSHSSGNQVVQQVVLAQQPNLSSQVSSVNPTGPPMPAPTGPNSGPNQLSVLQPSVPQVMSQQGQRYPIQQPFHHNQRPPQRALLQHRPQNAISSNSGAVVQTVQQNIGQNNLAHPQHTPHYYIVQPQMPTIQPQMINTHVNNMPHYTHQNRGMAQQMPQYTVYPTFANQQAFGQQAYPYMYPQQYHTQHQPSPQIITQQMHAQRGPPLTNTVIPASPVQIPGPAIGNNDVNETPQMQPKVFQKRQRQCAIITDPNSGENLDIVELASKDVSKNQTVVSATNESHSGASNLINTSSQSSPKTDSNVDIALQFAKQVVQKVTEKIPHINEIGVSSASNDSSKLEIEPLVANIDSNTTLSELSEQIDNNRTLDSEQDLSDKTLVNNTNSPISASISNFNTENEIKLLNNTSAQNLVENDSQNSVEITSGQEIQQNLDVITDSSENQLLPENDELAKDHSIQKVNNNQRRKDSINNEDNRILNDETLEVINVENNSDISQNTDVLETVEPQITNDSSSVTLSSIPTDKIETPVHNENICNNISENENVLDKKNEENIRLNDIKQIETSENDEIVNSDPIIPISKTIPGLLYASDQWSPSNPDGKKHYDRDFLMAVGQKAESCLKKPDSLNEALLSDIIRKPHQESSGSGLVSDDPFLPGYATNKGDFRNRIMRPMNTRQSQQSQRGGHNEKHGRKIISTSLTQDVKLHTTDNAWKPSQKVVAVNDEEQETLDLLKKIRGILNKLTPQKYDDLVKQIMGFKVDTEDRLKRVLDLVFEKAVDEPAFCLQYANLCKHLSSFKVIKIHENDKEEEVKFQKLLLSKCQKEFETDVYAGIEDFANRQKEVQECSDPAKKKMLFEILDEDMRRARKRSLGNIKLIGELYKLKMLRANIMVQCIENLLKDMDDESLECLCALLKTIGEQLESEVLSHPKAMGIIDGYFTQMDKIANQEISKVKSSSRVRFMLRDTIEMRKNNWKARRDENLPKMIDEIHQEAKREDQQKAQDLHTYQKKQEANKDRNQRGGRQTNDQNPDQWTTVSGRKSQTMQSQNQSMDWSKLRNQMGQNSDTIQLGPQTGVWSAGSRGGAQTSQSRYPDEKQLNRFSPLETGINDSRKSQKSNSIPSRDSSRGRSNQQHLYQQSGGGRRSQGRGEREDAINLARNFAAKPPPDSSAMYQNMISRNDSRSASREHSAPNSRNSSMRRETPDLEVNAGNQLKGTNISVEDLERKAMDSVKEYLSLKRMTEPVYDITKNFNDSNVHVYISTAINCALEITSQNDQFAIGQLICHMITNNIIKIQHFYQGLHSILEMAEDYIIDIPKLWDYIGDVLAPIFVELPLNERKQFLLESSIPCKSNKMRSEMIVKVVKAIAKLTSEVKANELWFSSNLNWEEFLDPNEDVRKFVEENNINFTMKGPAFDTNSTNIDENLQRFSDELIKLVKLRKSNDDIQNFISKYFNASQTSEIRFTSALFSAVIRGCLILPADKSFTYSLDTTALTAISPLLVKFFGGDPDVELQALNVLQDLMTELQHPANLLKNIFDILYENSVISHDAFLQWGKHDDNPAKAMAVASVMRFFTWLQENEDDDEDEEDIDVTNS